MIFDDVEVPRDRVFIDGDVELYNSVIRTSWWPNIMQHPMVRAEVKLHFAWALATLMTETIGGAQVEAQRMLGEIWTFAEFARRHSAPPRLMRATMATACGAPTCAR